MAAGDIKPIEQSLSEFYKQIREGARLGENVHFHQKIDSIMIVGMGASALVGEMMRDYLGRFACPVHVLRDYDVPPWVSKSTLVIAVSYSGNTEETIMAYREAVRKGCLMVAVGTGGKLAERCREDNRPFVSVPAGLLPLMAVGYQFMAVLNIIQNTGLLASDKQEIEDCANALRTNVVQLKGKELADLLKDKLPVVYASEQMKALASSWRTAINQLGKSFCVTNVLPSANHDEIEVFDATQSDVQVILLHVEEDSARIKKRMAITKEVVKQSRAHVVEIAIAGRYRLSRMFSTILLGFWAAYYLGKLYGVDPSSIEITEEFKRKIRD